MSLFDWQKSKYLIIFLLKHMSVKKNLANLLFEKPPKLIGLTHDILLLNLILQASEVLERFRNIKRLPEDFFVSTAQNWNEGIFIGMIHLWNLFIFYVILATINPCYNWTLFYSAINFIHGLVNALLQSQKNPTYIKSI